MPSGRPDGTRLVGEFKEAAECMETLEAVDSLDRMSDVLEQLALRQTPHVHELPRSHGIRLGSVENSHESRCQHGHRYICRDLGTWSSFLLL